MNHQIHGIDVILVEKTPAGVDAFGRQLFDERETVVSNVLVSPQESTRESVGSSTDMTPKEIAYTLAIPKGDTHTWEDRDVLFFGQRFHTEGFSWQGIEAMIPLDWNKKIVARRKG